MMAEKLVCDGGVESFSFQVGFPAASLVGAATGVAALALAGKELKHAANMGLSG